MAAKSTQRKRSADEADRTAASADAFSPEEKAAMKELAQERRAAAKRGPGNKADGEADLLAKVAEMAEPDRAMATRLHALIMSVAPMLSAKTWYGMPAWANGDQLICFFQSAAKFKTRYCTLGFTDKAKLDDGELWPTSFAIRSLGTAQEARIVALVKQAIG